jgi:polyphenol oxidase
MKDGFPGERGKHCKRAIFENGSVLKAPSLSAFSWLVHGFGWRDSEYPPGILRVRQIHSATVVDALQAASGTPQDGDALISNQPGMVVGIRTADCVPILIADPETHAVAAVHAGWRGSAQAIVSEAVRELVTRYGARAQNLHAAIGPAIGLCCYEVSAEVAKGFSMWMPEYGAAAAPTHIDLAAVNAIQLARAEVDNVWTAGECTFCLPERYFSYRREKEQAGRMTSFIGAI